MTDDFGFTTLSKEDIILDGQKDLQSEVKELKTKIQKLSNLCQNVITKLQLDPDKEYIHWPKRSQDVKRLEEQFHKILKG